MSEIQNDFCENGKCEFNRDGIRHTIHEHEKLKAVTALGKTLNKKRKIRIIVLVFVVVYTTSVIHFSQQVTEIFQSYGKLDPDSRHLIMTVFASVIGGLLFACRTVERIKKQFKKDITLEIIENVELLALVMIPTAEGFTYIIKTITNFPWAILLFFSSTIGWGLFVIRRHKIYNDPQDERQFLMFHLNILVGFVLLGIVATWTIITWLSLLNQIPK